VIDQSKIKRLFDCSLASKLKAKLAPAEPGSTLIDVSYLAL